LATDHAPAKLRRLAPGVSVHALVVDDVAENRDILSALLRQMGCGVQVAAGGLEAIECVKRQVPDIVFLDIRMPGMDGRETLRRLKEVLEGKAGAREQGPPARTSSDDGDSEGLASPAGAGGANGTGA
jgi:CheY-like chemotaxis protein